MAVELHQTTPNNSAASFDCELVATTLSPSAFVVRGPYLQNITPGAATIRWRTDVPTPSLVKWGLGRRSTRNVVQSGAVTTEHELRITGLAPDRVYYYAIGAGSDVMEGNDTEHWFRTLPSSGAVKPLRFWV